MRHYKEFEEKLQPLQEITSKPDWNLVDSTCLAISSGDWDRVRLFYHLSRQAIPDEFWREPFPSPCADGSIHLSWILPRGKVNVECGADAWHIYARFFTGTSIRSSGNINDVVTMLVGCFMEMFQRTKPGEDKA